MSVVDWVREKLGLIPTYGPPAAYVPPRPMPIAQSANAPLAPAEQPQASLVGSIAHSKGRKQDEGSLVGGR